MHTYSDEHIERVANSKYGEPLTFFDRMWLVGLALSIPAFMLIIGVETNYGTLAANRAGVLVCFAAIIATVMLNKRAKVKRCDGAIEQIEQEIATRDANLKYVCSIRVSDLSAAIQRYESWQDYDELLSSLADGEYWDADYKLSIKEHSPDLQPCAERCALYQLVTQFSITDEEIKINIAEYEKKQLDEERDKERKEKQRQDAYYAEAASKDR